MKINDKVMTPDSQGVIIGIDLPDCNKSAQRFIVKLDVQKFEFNPCYFQNELKLS